MTSENHLLFDFNALRPAQALKKFSAFVFCGELAI